MKFKYVKILKNINFWKLLSYIILLYLASMFVSRHKALFTFFFLLFLASISRLYNHYFFLPQLGFELYSTATVLTGLILGPMWGLLQGLLSNFFAYFLSGKIKYYTYISMVSWGLIGFVCGHLRHFNINLSILGVGFVLIYDLITTPIFVISGARITSALFHFVTHFLLSLFLFRTVAPLLYTMLR
jgi:LytS/YehU family sensor histidine kinase